MALADDLRALREQTLTRLRAAHDYYFDSRVVWKTIPEQVAAGRVVSYHNAATGTTTTPDELATRIDRYISDELRPATFIRYIAIFESFFFDILRLWLRVYPHSLANKKIDFKTVLEAPDRETIITAAVEREVNEVLYERPAGWFAYLEERVKIGCPSADAIARIAEAKASRDVLVHAQGVVGPSYLFKAGTLARYRDGELLDLPEPYHEELWNVLCQVVDEVGTALAAKS